MKNHALLLVFGLMSFCFPTYTHYSGGSHRAIVGSIQQQNSAKTEIPGKGPCTSFPKRYKSMEVRLAWFYGCMHEDPPTVADIKAKIAALPSEKRKALENQDFATQEALLGVASYDLATASHGAIR